MLTVGAEVRVSFSRSGGHVRNSDLFTGKITAVNDDGTFAVQYDDGDAEKNVQLGWMLLRRQLYSGIVKSISDDGLYDVTLISGEECKGLSRERINVRGGGVISVGDRVEINLEKKQVEGDGGDGGDGGGGGRQDGDPHRDVGGARAARGED